MIDQETLRKLETSTRLLNGIGSANQSYPLKDVRVTGKQFCSPCCPTYVEASSDSDRPSEFDCFDMQFAWMERYTNLLRAHRNSLVFASFIHPLLNYVQEKNGAVGDYALENNAARKNELIGESILFTKKVIVSPVAIAPTEAVKRSLAKGRLSPTFILSNSLNEEETNIHVFGIGDTWEDALRLHKRRLKHHTIAALLKAA